MHNKGRLTVILILLLLLMAGLIGYRIYLFVYEGDYQNLNAQNIDQIEKTFDEQKGFQFAVAGNIQNSMRLFEQRIIPLVEENKTDFMISLGNAVFDGAEAKYRLLFRGLKELDIPKVMTIGDYEVEDFGSSLFYRHFGPYFFSFPLQDAYFLFLDTTGQTSWTWQYRWIEQELKHAQQYRYRFIFMNRSMFALQSYTAHHVPSVLDEATAEHLHQLFKTYGVTAVFSSGYPTFSQTQRDGIQYIISGAAGGLLLERNSPYQIVRVNVGPEGVSYEKVLSPDSPSRFSERIERLKLFLHSFVYMNLFNLLLIITTTAIIALRLYTLILKQEHLYRDFNVDEQTLQKNLSVVMFTNNYLPFIGGVPLSIQRLASGLKQLGHQVHIFAPAYPDSPPDDAENQVIRCQRLFQANLSGFPIVNLFSPRIAHTFKALDCRPCTHPSSLLARGEGDAFGTKTPYPDRVDLPYPSGAVYALSPDSGNSIEEPVGPSEDQGRCQSLRRNHHPHAIDGGIPEESGSKRIDRNHSHRHQAGRVCIMEQRGSTLLPAYLCKG